MSLQGIYDAASSGFWQDPDAGVCGCKGSGWLLSDVDTFHWCQYHGVGVSPPPDCSGDKHYQKAYEANPFLYEGVSLSRELHYLIKQAERDGKSTLNIIDVAMSLNGLNQAIHDFEERKRRSLDDIVLNRCVAENVSPHDDRLKPEYNARMKEIKRKNRDAGLFTEEDLVINTWYRLRVDFNETHQDVDFHYPRGTQIRFDSIGQYDGCKIFRFETVNGYTVCVRPEDVMPFDGWEGYEPPEGGMVGPKKDVNSVTSALRFIPGANNFSSDNDYGDIPF